ncbi:MAG: hypothetical protein ACW99Q_15310, partial [Candidatus Kariarchaeaceae archaeon]
MSSRFISPNLWGTSKKKSFRVKHGGELTKKFIRFVKESEGVFPDIPESKEFSEINDLVQEFIDTKIFNPRTKRFNSRKRVIDSQGNLRGKYQLEFDLVNGRLQGKKMIMRDVATGIIKHVNVSNELPLLAQEFSGEDEKVSMKDVIQMIKTGKAIKGIELMEEVPPGKLVNILMRFTITFISNGEESSRTRSQSVNVRPRDLTEQFHLQVIRVLWPFLETEGYFKRIDWDVEYLSVRDESDAFTKENSVLRGDPIKIFNRNLVDMDDEKYHSDDLKRRHVNCVKNFLLHHWKNMSPSMIDSISQDDGVSVKQLYDFCVSKKIKMIIYDINGNVIKQHLCKANKKHKQVFAIAYHGHFYPLKSKYLEKSKPIDEVKIIDDASDKLKEFLEEKKLPSNIFGSWNTKKSESVDILSFEIDDVKYVDNSEYEKCKAILTAFGLADKMRIGTNLRNVVDIIEPLYTETLEHKTTNSFWPEASKFVKGGYNYHNGKYDDQYCAEMGEFVMDEKVETIDKNKAYTHALKHLPWLVTIDYMQSTITTINKQMSDGVELVAHNLYIASPRYSTILMDNENVYTGEHLTYCWSQGIEFFIKEEMTTTKCRNVYYNMITDIFNKVSMKDAKTMMNIWIGKCERDQQVKTSVYIDNVYTNEEAEMTQGFKVRFTDDYQIVVGERSSFSIYNKKPISIQIKDKTRRTMYTKMKSLGLTSDDIIQIKTDSITFIHRDDGSKLNYSNHINGWKKESYKPINCMPRFKTSGLTFYNERTPNNNILQEGKAGCGKTYNAINNIIPSLEDDYIVLSPTHATLEDYRKVGINSAVVQSYYHSKIPNEKVIIADEIGLF